MGLPCFWMKTAGQRFGEGTGQSEVVPSLASIIPARNTVSKPSGSGARDGSTIAGFAGHAPSYVQFVYLCRGMGVGGWGFGLGAWRCTIEARAGDSRHPRRVLP